MPNFSSQQGILNKAWKQGSGNTGNWKPSGKSSSGQRPNNFTGRRKTQRSGRSTSFSKRPRGKTTSSSFNFNNVRNRARSATSAQNIPPSSPKPSSANNISRFGKGLKGRLGATLNQAKAIAAKVGLKGAKLSATLASSKFLAGSASVTGIGLLLGNGLIWSSNIKKIRNIYRGGSNASILIKARSTELIDSGIPAYRGFEPGGGTPGIAYGIPYAHAKYENGEVLPAHDPFNGFYVTATAPLPEIGLWINGNETDLTKHWSSAGEGIEPIWNRTINGTYLPIVDGVVISRNFRGRGIYLFGWVRLDGEPDLEDRDDLSDPVLAVEGVSNGAIPQLEPSELQTPNPNGYKPSGSQNIRGVSGLSKIKNPLEYDPLNPAEKPAESPQKGDFPAILNDPTLNPLIKGKPSGAPKPSLLDLIPVAAIGLAVPPNLGGVARIPEQTKTPVSPRINRCKKGCAGATGGGNAQATLNNGALIANLANDLILQNGLLNKIDNKLGTQIPNGGLAGAADKLHKSLAIDRWLNLINTALLLHNATYLSSAVLDTVTGIVDNVLETTGIQFTAPDGSEIGFSQVISSTVRGLFVRVLGESTVNSATNIYIKSNRFLNSGANLLSNFRNIADGAQDIAETMAENVSLIGNALKKAGAVRESAYDWMPERFDNPSRLINKLEKLGDKADVLESITSDVQDISEDIKDLKESKEEFLKAKEEAQKALNTEQSDLKQAAVDTPVPTEEDEARATDDN